MANEPALGHKELVDRACQWLRSRAKCYVVLADDQNRGGSGECPDAIGWRYGRSILVECKASLSDFQADRKKPWRQADHLGMGEQRWFMMPIGLATVAMSFMPPKWGLLGVNGRRAEILVAAQPFDAYAKDMELLLSVSVLRAYQAQKIDYKRGVERWGESPVKPAVRAAEPPQ